MCVASARTAASCTSPGGALAQSASASAGRRGRTGRRRAASRPRRGRLEVFVSSFKVVARVLEPLAERCDRRLGSHPAAWRATPPSGTFELRIPCPSPSRAPLRIPGSHFPAATIVQHADDLVRVALRPDHRRDAWMSQRRVRLLLGENCAEELRSHTSMRELSAAVTVHGSAASLLENVARVPSHCQAPSGVAPAESASWNRTRGVGSSSKLEGSLRRAVGTSAKKRLRQPQRVLADAGVRVVQRAAARRSACNSPSPCSVQRRLTRPGVPACHSAAVRGCVWPRPSPAARRAAAGR